MPTRKFSLTDQLNSFVEASVSSGQYRNASELVREALRLLAQRQQEDALRLERLRMAVREGEEAYMRGEYVSLSAEELGDYLAGLGETARTRTEA
jgi:antitoxin ParD1/3/4